MSAALIKHAALRISASGEPEQLSESLAEESAIALLFNGVPFAVMMATPTDLHDYAVGFALSEQIIGAADELELIDVIERESGLALHLGIPSGRFERLQRHRRLIGASGCGLCGAETLAQAIRTPQRLESAERLDRSDLNRSMGQLAEQQPLNRQCGSLHAAAVLTESGLVIREDVGRHNAVDKVIGALARNSQDARAVLVTSRASYELVHKVATAQIPILAAVSAPTAHAVRLAAECGLTLVAYAREGRMTIYSEAQRIAMADQTLTQ